MVRSSRAGRRDRGGAPPVPTAAAAPRAWLRGGSLARPGLALITLAGAVLRFAALRYQPMVTGDGTEYVRFADALRAGRGFRSVFPPGYPLLITLTHLVIPDRVGAAVAVSMLAGISLPAIVWMLARGALGERGALLPALFCALHLELARHSAVTLSESAYVAVLYLGLAAFSAPVVTPGWRRAAAGGLALGCAFAIRPEALATILALAGIVAGARRRLPARSVLAAAGACLVVVLACIFWYHQTLGTWTLTPKIAALHEVERDWRTVEPHVADAAASAGPLATRLVASVRAWPVNAAMHGEALLWSWPWPLLVLSLWGLARRRGIEAAALLYLPLLPFLGLTQQARFGLPAVPALAICAAAPLLGGRARLRGAAIALAVFGQFACAWAFSEAFRTPLEGGRDTDRLAGEWLAQLAKPGDVVVDRKPYVAFYASRIRHTPAAGNRDAVLDQMVKSHARWFVLQDYVAHQMRPELAPLLDSAGVRERETRIELVYARADAGDGSLAIFRVLQPGEKKSGAPPVVQTTGFGGQPGR